MGLQEEFAAALQRERLADLANRMIRQNAQYRGGAPAADLAGPGAAQVVGQVVGKSAETKPIDHGQDQEVEDQPVVTIPADLRRLLDQLPPDDPRGLRPAYRRDHLFRLWNSQQGGFGPVKIANKWNQLPDKIRKIVSPRLSVKVSSDTAKRSLTLAKREHKTTPKKRSRTRS